MLNKRSPEEIKAIQDNKNNQDFIYQTNQSLQNLKIGLESLKERYDSLHCLIENRSKSLDISFSNLEDKCLVITKDCVSSLNDFRDLLDHFFNEAEKRFKNIEFGYIKKIDYQNQVEKSEKRDEGLQKNIDSLKDYSDSQIHLLKSSLNSEISSQRQDILSQIPKVDLNKEELETCLKCVYQDMLGLKQEIERLKKSDRYSEKKFENIYTLIERLKAGG